LVGRGGLEPRQLAESSHLGILNRVPHGPDPCVVTLEHWTAT